MAILVQAHLRKCADLANQYLAALEERLDANPEFDAAIKQALSPSEHDAIFTSLKMGMGLKEFSAAVQGSAHKERTVLAPHIITLANAYASVITRVFGAECAGDFLPAKARNTNCAAHFRKNNASSLAPLCLGK
jgi:hypothetical protein